MDYKDLKSKSTLSVDFAGAFFSTDNLSMAAVLGITANFATSYLTGVMPSITSLALHTGICKSILSISNVQSKQRQRELEYWTNPGRDIFLPQQPLSRIAGYMVEGVPVAEKVCESSLRDITPQN